MSALPTFPPLRVWGAAFPEKALQLVRSRLVLRQRRGFCSVTRESVNRIAFVILKRYCVPGSGLASVALEAEPSGLRQEARRRETLQAASRRTNQTRHVRLLCVTLLKKHIFLPSPRLSRLTDSAGASLDDLKNLHCRALALKSLRDFIFIYLYISPPPSDAVSGGASAL